MARLTNILKYPSKLILINTTANIIIILINCQGFVWRRVTWYANVLYGVGRVANQGFVWRRVTWFANGLHRVGHVAYQGFVWGRSRGLPMVYMRYVTWCINGLYGVGHVVCQWFVWGRSRGLSMRGMRWILYYKVLRKALIVIIPLLRIITWYLTTRRTEPQDNWELDLFQRATYYLHKQYIVVFFNINKRKLYQRAIIIMSI